MRIMGMSLVNFLPDLASVFHAASLWLPLVNRLYYNIHQGEHIQQGQWGDQYSWW
jgi:hypothetical protein